MKAYPDIHHDLENDNSCWPGVGDPTGNSIKALCNVAVKVTATGAGIVKWAPLVKDSYYYGFPVGWVPHDYMNCKDHNASGLFTSESCPA
jgi:hypothetical protein